MRWPESPDKLTACRKWLAGCQCNQLDSYLAHMFVQNLEYVKITQQTMSQLKSTSCKLVKMLSLWLVDAMRNWNIESTLKMIWVYSRAVEYESWSLYIYICICIMLLLPFEYQGIEWSFGVFRSALYYSQWIKIFSTQQCQSIRLHVTLTMTQSALCKCIWTNEQRHWHN